MVAMARFEKGILTETIPSLQEDKTLSNLSA